MRVCLCGRPITGNGARCELCQSDYDTLPTGVKAVYEHFLAGVMPIYDGDDPDYDDYATDDPQREPIRQPMRKHTRGIRNRGA